MLQNGARKATAEKYLGGLILDLIDNSDHINDRFKKSKAVLFNIKFNNMFHCGIQFKLAKLLIYNLIRSGVTFGSTFFNLKEKEVQKLEIFQNCAMREALRLDSNVPTAFLRVMLGVCSIGHGLII